MGYLIESLTKKEGKAGVVFISHASENIDDVKLQIISQFNNEGIEHFISSGQISCGDDFKKVINYHLDKASCGVVVLSQNALKSDWVWYEIGWLLARQRCLFYVLGKINENDIKQIQGIAGKDNITDNFEDLKRKLKEHTPIWGNFGPISGGVYYLHEDILKNIKQARISISFSIKSDNSAKEFIENNQNLSFGYKFIRFGRENCVKHPAYMLYENHWHRENNKYYRGKVKLTNNAKCQNINVKADCIIPIHKILGVTFLPFLEVREPLSDIIQESINQENFTKVGHTEKFENIQRTYFLLPLRKKWGIISEENREYNYIYPL